MRLFHDLEEYLEEYFAYGLYLKDDLKYVFWKDDFYVAGSSGVALLWYDYIIEKNIPSS